MTTVNLKLFGGRIDATKFALKATIQKFKETGHPDMAIIYEDMLRELEQQEATETSLVQIKRPNINVNYNDALNMLEDLFVELINPVNSPPKKYIEGRLTRIMYKIKDGDKEENIRL